jgi:PHD/YefM family antitoxin component YafN of YafNO toxin-antitoxin module
MKATLKKEPQFITDKKGKKLSVVISVTEYKKMLEELEELEDIKQYDAVKARKEQSIPFSQYLQQRRKKHA